MEEKELLELLETFNARIRTVVALSHELIAHPFYPHTPDRQTMAESLLTVQNGLISSLATSIGQLDFAIGGIGEKLAFFNQEQERSPIKKTLN